MRRDLDKGIELLQEVEGAGCVASKGACLVYNARFFLRRGDEIPMDAKSIELYRSHHRLRTVDGTEVIDHSTTLGRRQAIAAVEKTLQGMRVGGFREVLASPHLCYGESGLNELIPPNAMLRIQIWLRDAVIEPG